MKTKELIKRLQENDPSGELEVVAGDSKEGWVDIYFTEVMEGYYDGPYQTLVHDPLAQGYSVIGAKYRTDGKKLVLHLMSIKDCLLDNPELPVEIIDDSRPEELAKRVEKWRKDVKRDIFFVKAEEIYSRFEAKLLADGHYGEHVYIDVDKEELIYVGKSAVEGLKMAQARKTHGYCRTVGRVVTL